MKNLVKNHIQNRVAAMIKFQFLFPNLFPGTQDVRQMEAPAAGGDDWGNM